MTFFHSLFWFFPFLTLKVHVFLPHLEHAIAPEDQNCGRSISEILTMPLSFTGHAQIPRGAMIGSE